MRVCKNCKVNKSIEAYGRQVRSRGGKQKHYRRKWCDACHNARKIVYFLRVKFGMTPEEKVAMFERQGKRCAACKAETPGTKIGWHMDHCHVTKRVRGILCHHCNAALGQAKDSIDRLRSLVQYLEDTKPK